MRILREDETITKEVLPVSFITDMVSKSWDEVGYLKEAAVAIKEAYKDTSKIESLMQDLMDAYLVFIGQLELYLDKEKDITTEVDNKAEREDSEAEKPAEVAEPEIIDEPQEAELPEAELEVAPIQAPPVERTPAPALVAEDDFDFFVDFDEPDMSQGPMTDDELYGEDGKLNSTKPQRLNG